MPACGGTTYATPYAAMVDGCVSTYQKGYGNFFLENRINEYNLYAEDQWQVADTLSLSLGARFEYVATPTEKEDRIVYGYEDNAYVDPRIALRLGAEAPTAASSGPSPGGPGNASIRGGFGIYHGRIFQSIFSQSGANLRFNPPNAALLSFTNQLNLSDPSNGYVFTPGATPTTRITILEVDPELAMPQVLAVERQLRAEAPVGRDAPPQLRRQPRQGPPQVHADEPRRHAGPGRDRRRQQPVQRAGRGVPRPAGRPDQQGRGRLAMRGNGLSPRAHGERGLPRSRSRSRTTRSASGPRGPTSAAATPVTGRT